MKVWEVELTYSIPVYAATEADALRIAERHVRDEDPDWSHANELSRAYFIPDWNDVYPWRDDDFFGEERTVGSLLEGGE